MRLAIAALTALAVPARADELANSPVRAGYEPTGRVLDFEARRRWDVEHGVDPMLTYVFDTFAAPQLANCIVASGLLMAELDLALDKLIAPGWGAAYISGVAIHGSGISNELMDVHGVDGNVAPEDVRLFEAWLEQPIGPATLRAGLLAVDQEFVLAARSSTLISATFGMTSQFSANVVGPTYPVGAPGASARLESDDLALRLAIFDGTQSNTRGIPDALGPAMLAIGEVAAGPLELGGWHHDELGTGYYAIVDAQLEPRVGAFARTGYSPDGPVTHYIDAGARVTPSARRPDDFASAGIAFATTAQGMQTLVELTYEMQLGWLTIQPDLQLLLLRDRTVGVLGTRATVVF